MSICSLPTVLSKMNLQISDQDINKEFKELYSKNPLFYKNIPSSFQSMPAGASAMPLNAFQISLVEKYLQLELVNDEEKLKV